MIIEMDALLDIVFFLEQPPHVERLVLKVHTVMADSAKNALIHERLAHPVVMQIAPIELIQTRHLQAVLMYVHVIITSINLELCLIVIYVILRELIVLVVHMINVMDVRMGIIFNQVLYRNVDKTVQISTTRKVQIIPVKADMLIELHEQLAVLLMTELHVKTLMQRS